MSYSVSFKGTPEAVAKSLKEYEISDPGSKIEFNEVRPHLIGLVEQNCGNPSRQIELSAYGHGYRVEEEGTRHVKTCSVSLKETDPLV